MTPARATEAGCDGHGAAAEGGTVIAAVVRGDYQVTLGGWSGLLDTDSNSWSMLHTGGALNTSHYSNPAVDAALDAARTEAAPDSRRASYAAVWNQVGTDQPVVYLWTPCNIQGASRRITGLTLMPDGLLRLQDVARAR